MRSDQTRRNAFLTWAVACWLLGALLLVVSGSDVLRTWASSQEPSTGTPIARRYEAATKARWSLPCCVYSTPDGRSEPGTLLTAVRVAGILTVASLGIGVAFSLAGERRRRTDAWSGQQSLR